MMFKALTAAENGVSVAIVYTFLKPVIGDACIRILSGNSQEYPGDHGPSGCKYQSTAFSTVGPYDSEDRLRIAAAVRNDVWAVYDKMKAREQERYLK